MRVAALQYCAGATALSTLAHITPMIKIAAAGGARLVCLPEAADFLAVDRDALSQQAEWEDDCTTVKILGALARDLDIWLLVGSLFVRRRLDEKLVNRGYLIDPTGCVAAQYDKIHMFDANVGDGQSYRESASFEPGERAVLGTIDSVRMGMTTCYDVRFPHLFRALATAGAAIITVPAAFTFDSGRAHWHVLLRARAIETGCFIIAPAQCGTHADGRRTYGHALIISPWGTILGEAKTDDTNAKTGANDDIIFADLDMGLIDQARQAIPALYNDRPFAPPTAD